MGKVVLVCSGKGGVGKTTLVTNLGAALSKRNVRTLILDMNVGLRNDDIYLGMENSILFDLGDVISGMCSIDKAIIKHDMCRNLYLLSCPQYREIDGLCASHIRALYAKLKKEFDIILVDCPVVTGLNLINLSSGADEAIIVVTPDFTAVRNGDAINKKLAAQGMFTRYHVINKLMQQTMNAAELPDIVSITKTLDTDCLGMLPFDADIHLSNNDGMPSVLLENSYLAKPFDNMANRLTKI